MAVFDESEWRIRGLLFGPVLELTDDGIVILDGNNQVRFYNVAAIRLLGLPMNSPSLGGQHSAVAKLIDAPELEQNLGCFAQFVDVAGERWRLLRITRRNSHFDTVELVAQARTDHLSGLLNRRGFQQALESNAERRLALAIIDVDFFKRINDEHGHETGDLAIQWISNQLRQEFEDAICIGRLGGDEFGVVLDGSSANLEARFVTFCDRVSQTKVDWSARGITISIGLAISSTATVGARTLLTQADRAMYRAKSAGRNRAVTVLVEA